MIVKIIQILQVILCFLFYIYKIYNQQDNNQRIIYNLNDGSDLNQNSVNFYMTILHNNEDLQEFYKNNKSYHMAFFYIFALSSIQLIYCIIMADIIDVISYLLLLFLAVIFYYCSSYEEQRIKNINKLQMNCYNNYLRNFNDFD